MLQGFVPFPEDFATRYRAQGYWRDQSLAQEFSAVFERFADRTALIDGERRYTYAELDAVSDNLALNLLGGIGGLVIGVSAVINLNALGESVFSR